MMHKSGERSQGLKQRLEDWFQQPVGKQILGEEMQLIRHLLPQYFGYFLVHLGPAFSVPLNDFTPIKRCYHVVPEGIKQKPVVWPCLQASAQSLPFKKHSVDLLILQHSLDMTDNVHQLLREVDRVLVPGGGVIIVGFNPFSLWGIARLLLGKGRFKQDMPWLARFWSPYRVTDWLQLLNFDVSPLETRFRLLPSMAHRSSVDRQEGGPVSAWRSWLSGVLNPLGGVYVLSAKKRQTMITPVKPRWSIVSGRFQGAGMRPIATPQASSTSPSAHLKSSDKKN